MAVAGFPQPIEEGNLPLGIRHRVPNADGSISTVRTISIGIDGGEVVIPTVIGGRVVSDAEAVAHYERTGENFGTFQSPEDAAQFSQWLHNQHSQEMQGFNATQLNDITAHSESGNRNFGANGRPVTSSAGARFAMQVMPATARDPGFGLRPADPNNADDMNRLGREYRAAMERRYGGDLAQMWAAYNAGPGRVDDAIRRHGEGWLRHLPRETQNYVAQNLRALGN